MKTLSKLFNLKWTPRIKTPNAKGTLAGRKETMTTETRTIISLPRTFDFIAYFDDNELENNAEDISLPNPTVDIKHFGFLLER